MKEKSLTILGLTSVKLSNRITAAQDETALIRSLFGNEKRAVIRELIQVDKKDEDAFWLMYEAYEQQLKKLDRKREKGRAEILCSSDIEAAVMASSELLEWTGRYLRFYTRHYKKFKKMLDSEKTAALFRLQLTWMLIGIKQPGGKQSAPTSTTVLEEIKLRPVSEIFDDEK